MRFKWLAALAAACAAACAAPARAQALSAPMTTIFLEVPLDARTAKELVPTFGLQLQGSRPYQSLRIDQRMLGYRPGFAIAGIEGTYLVAGALGIVAVAALAGKDGATTRELDRQKAKQQQACPTSTCGQ